MNHLQFLEKIRHALEHDIVNCDIEFQSDEQWFHLMFEKLAIISSVVKQNTRMSYKEELETELTEFGIILAKWAEDLDVFSL